MSYQQITDLSSVKTLTIPSGAVGVLLQTESQITRFRTDGTDPTSTVGMQLFVGDPPVAIYGVDAMQKMKFIQAAASAILNVTYLYS